MKKTHIVLIIVIAVLIGAILVMFKDAGTYAGFAFAEENKGQELTIKVGDKTYTYGRNS